MTRDADGDGPGPRGFWVERDPPAGTAVGGRGVMAEKFYSPSGEEWPVFAFSVVDRFEASGRDDDRFEDRYCASVTFKRSPLSWWMDAGGLAGAPPQVLRAMAKAVLDLVPDR